MPESHRDCLARFVWIETSSDRFLEGRRGGNVNRKASLLCHPDGYPRDGAGTRCRRSAWTRWSQFPSKGANRASIGNEFLPVGREHDRRMHLVESRPDRLGHRGVEVITPPKHV